MEQTHINTYYIYFLKWWLESFTSSFYGMLWGIMSHPQKPPEPPDTNPRRDTIRYRYQVNERNFKFTTHSNILLQHTFDISFDIRNIRTIHHLHGISFRGVFQSYETLGPNCVTFCRVLSQRPLGRKWLVESMFTAYTEKHTRKLSAGT